MTFKLQAILFTQAFVFIWAGCPGAKPYTYTDNEKYKQAVTACGVDKLTDAFNSITPANQDMLCTTSCKDALQTLKLEYSTCTPALLPCEMTENPKATCQESIGGCRNAECVGSCVVCIPPKLGVCKCTGQYAGKCFNPDLTSGCEDNPDIPSFNAQKENVATVAEIVKKADFCSSSQLQCCPGQKMSECNQEWCQDYFTPQCLSKSETCYNQPAVVIGCSLGGVAILAIIGGIVAVVIVNKRRAKNGAWGRAGGYQTDINNPARYR